MPSAELPHTAVEPVSLVPAPAAAVQPVSVALAPAAAGPSLSALPALPSFPCFPATLSLSQLLASGCL